jgi:membrane protease YdiL (CAAX protease family)
MFLRAFVLSCFRVWVLFRIRVGKVKFSEIKPAAQRGLWASIGLAFVLWAVLFVFKPFNFWLMLTFSTSLLAALAFLLGRPLILLRELTAKNLLLGVMLAALLYAFFYAGNRFLMLASRLLPSLLPDRAGNIASVYANLGGLSPALVGLLLFFPIGFGEEVFWRGFVQRRLKERWNPSSAFVVTTLLYTAIHLATGNPVLVLAAFTCGLFWGGFYWATGSLVPVLVSHMLWDPFIFVVCPIK